MLLFNNLITLYINHLEKNVKRAEGYKKIIRQRKLIFFINFIDKYVESMYNKESIIWSNCICTQSICFSGGRENKCQKSELKKTNL